MSTYKAIPIQVTTHHADYDTSEIRYFIVSTETGEVIDDAQGYGYKTAQKAYAGYAYKKRDRGKDAEKLAKKEAYSEVDEGTSFFCKDNG